VIFTSIKTTYNGSIRTNKPSCTVKTPLIVYLKVWPLMQFWCRHHSRSNRTATFRRTVHVLSRLELGHWSPDFPKSKVDQAHFSCPGRTKHPVRSEIPNWPTLLSAHDAGSRPPLLELKLKHELSLLLCPLEWDLSTRIPVFPLQIQIRH